jgi:hypothetical protein
VLLAVNLQDRIDARIAQKNANFEQNSPDSHLRFQLIDICKEEVQAQEHSHEMQYV